MKKQNFIKQKLLTLIKISFVFSLIFFLRGDIVNGSTSMTADQLNTALFVSSDLSTTADRYWYPIDTNYGFSFSGTTTITSVTLKIKNSATVMNSPNIQIFRQFGAGTCNKTGVDTTSSIASNYNGTIKFTFSSTCTIPGGSKFYLSMNGEVGTSFQLYGTNVNTSGADLKAKYGSSGVTSDATLYHAYVYLQGSGITPLSPDGNNTTHIISVTPSSSATTTIPVSTTLTYWLGDDLDKTTNPKVEMYLTNFDTGSTPYKFYSNAVSTTTGLYTITTSITDSLVDGLWQISPQLIDSNIIEFQQTPVKLGWFLIGSTKFDSTTLSKTVTESLGRQKSPYENCSITDLSGCFKNAFTYLFTPSENITDNFRKIDLSTRAPFIYAYQINDLRQDMFNATGTGTTTLAVTVHNFGTITFLSKSMIDSVPYSGTIKTILGYLIWLLMAEYIYYRVIRIHDNTPQ